MIGTLISRSLICGLVLSVIVKSAPVQNGFHSRTNTTQKMQTEKTALTIMNNGNAAYPMHMASTIAGANWTAIGESNRFFYEGIFACTIDTAGAIYLCGDDVTAGGLCISSIGRWDGKNWSVVAPGIRGTEIDDLEIDKKGNLYAVGRFESVGGIIMNHIAMWDGKKWNSVGNGTPERLGELEFDKDGNMYVCEQTSSGSVVLKSDGTGWRTLGICPNGTIDAFELDTADNLYVAGQFDTINRAAAKNIARWNGTTWENIGGIELSEDSSSVYVYWLGCDGMGTIYAAGNFDRVGSKPITGIARWNGSEWNALGTGIGKLDPIYQFQCTIGQDGFLYLCGNLHNTGPFSKDESVVRWDGTDWQSLSLSLPPSPHFIAVNKDAVYISYYEHTDPNRDVPYEFRLFKTSSHGWVDACGGNGFDWVVSSIVYDRDGNLYAGGDFDFAGKEQVNHIARWDGQRWIGLGNGLKCSVHALAVDSSGVLYAGGSYYDNVENTGVMRWDGKSWISLDAGKKNGFRLEHVYTLAVDRNGLLYAGGSSDYGAGLLVWDGSVWSETCATITGNTVNVIAFNKKGDLYIGGDFNRAGSVVAQSIARWDGSVWNTLGEGISRELNRLSPVNALAFDSKGNLYAGGGFEYAGGVEARNVAKWNGSQWSAMETKNDKWERSGDVVQCMLIDDNDNLYVGGHFDSIGVVAAKSIAVWDGISWGKIDGSVEGSWSGSIYDLSLKDNILAVGGGFESAGGKTSVNFAFCNLEGAAAAHKPCIQKSRPEFRYDKATNTMKLSLEDATRIQTTVYTLCGREVYRSSQTLLKGRHTFRFETSRLSVGAYVVQVEAGRESLRYRLLVHR